MNLVSQPIKPNGTFLSIKPLTTAEPAIPAGFIWKKTHHPVAKLVKSHKAYDKDRTHGSSEQYLRRHWYTFEMTDGHTWLVYFERSSKNWILHSIQ